MTDPGLIDLLDHMRAAASDACGFVEGLTKDAFLEIVWDTVQSALPELLLSLSKEAGGAVADLS